MILVCLFPQDGLPSRRSSNFFCRQSARRSVRLIRARTIWGGRRVVAVPDDGHPVRLQSGSSPDNTAARWHGVVNFVARWAGLGPGTVTLVSFKFPPTPISTSELAVWMSLPSRFEDETYRDVERDKARTQEFTHRSETELTTGRGILIHFNRRRNFGKASTNSRLSALAVHFSKTDAILMREGFSGADSRLEVYRAEETEVPAASKTVNISPSAKERND